MPQHQLLKGKKFISAISQLGILLGYYVKNESPVEDDKKNPSSVDVAWFKEEDQKFPLFIFEIESKSTNSMTYNPLKVFSKSNQTFEKPLFFFQIILKGGQNSSRVDDLLNNFGKYNYRIYRASANEIEILFLDILSQHRRLTQSLNIINLVEFIFENEFLNLNLDIIINQIEKLEFEKNSGNLLISYAVLSLKFDEIIPYFCTFLKKIQKEPLISNYPLEYSTYWGSSWYYPIHLGILFCYTNDLYEKSVCIKLLKAWQEHGSYMSMIGPHFGLSMDYDLFLISWSGFLFAVLSVLFSDFKTMRIYFAKELKKIIEKSKDEYKVINMYWLMHIVPNTKEGLKLYNYGKLFFKNMKCFSLEDFYSPPYNFQYEEYYHSFITEHDKIPEKTELKSHKNNISKKDIIKFSISLLVNENHDENISKYLVNLLSQHNYPCSSQSHP